MSFITERGDPRDRITNQLPLRHRRTEMIVGNDRLAALAELERRRENATGRMREHIEAEIARVRRDYEILRDREWAAICDVSELDEHEHRGQA